MNAHSRNLIVASTALAAWIPSWSACAQGQSRQGFGFGGHMTGNGEFDWMMGPMELVVWSTILVVAAVAATLWISGRGYARKVPPKSDLDDLNERYGRGEIDGEEYEQRRNGLNET